MNLEKSVTFHVAEQKARLLTENGESTWNYSSPEFADDEPHRFVPVPVIVSVFASATGRDANSAGGRDEWWRLELPIVDARAEKHGIEFEDQWLSHFTLTFVGDCQAARADTYIEVTYNHENEEINMGYYLDPDVEYDEEYIAFLLREGADDPRISEKFLGGIVSRFGFRPERILGSLRSEVWKWGFSPEDVWYARAITGPGEGMYRLEFRAEATWKRPAIQSPVWS